MNNFLRTCLVALTVLNLSIVGAAQQPPPPTALEILDRLKVEIDARIDAMRLELAPPPLPTIVILMTREELDAAIVTAADGAVLNIDTALQYPDPFVISRSRITVQSVELLDGRMDLAQPLPRFLNGLTAAGDDITVRGLDVRVKDPRFAITSITGARVTYDRMRVLGDPVKGAKRGVVANGRGDVAIVRSYIAEWFCVFPCEDTQAIIAWDMLPGLLIEDNYLEGGGENIMLGGADSSDEAHMPRKIRIRKNTIAKKPAWKTMPVAVKNMVEFKAGEDALVEDNDISGSWGKAPGNGGGQDGYGIVLTVHNQDGRAPWTTIRDVVVRNNRISNVAAAFTILGLENRKETKTGVGRVPIGTLIPSVRMHNVTIASNQVKYDVAGNFGSAKLILIDGGPSALTFDGNTFEGTGATSVVYLGSAKSEQLNLTRNTWPPTLYGIFLNAVGRITTANWLTAVVSGTLADNIVR